VTTLTNTAPLANTAPLIVFPPVPQAAAAPKGRSAAGRALSWSTTLALIALVVLAVLVDVVPWATKGAALTVYTGSMEPLLHPGDVVVVAGVSDPATVEVGDVVTYLPLPDDPTLITHRVIGKAANRDGSLTFTFQGDANSAIDDPVGGHQVRGKMLYSIPHLGDYREIGGTNIDTVATALGVALAIWAVWLIFFSGRRRREPVAPSAQDNYLEASRTTPAASRRASGPICPAPERSSR
jgi:signal peptidase